MEKCKRIYSLVLSETNKNCSSYPSVIHDITYLKENQLRKLQNPRTVNSAVSNSEVEEILVRVKMQDFVLNGYIIARG